MTQDIQFESGRISAGDCISGGWELIRDQYWLFFGIAILAAILTACIPCVNIFIAGPVMTGVFYCLLIQIRGQQPVDFGMMFKGFENIVPTMVVGILTILPEIISTGFQYTVRFANLGAELNRGGGNRDFFTSQETFFTTGIIIAAVIIGLVFFLIAIAWRITFFFALLLLADHPDLEIMETIKLSARAGWANWGMIIVLSIFQGLVMLAGFCALCVGALFVIPIVQASTAIAYRQVFPDTITGGMYNVPPPPMAYGNQFRG